MNCKQTKNTRSKLRIEVGMTSADSLISRYGENIPKEEIRKEKIKHQFDTEEPSFMDMSSIQSIIDNLENNTIDNKTINDAIFRLQNEKNLLNSRVKTGSIIGNNAYEKIIEITDDISRLKNEGKLSRINDIVRNNTMSWIDKDIINSTNIDTGKLNLAFQELDMLKDLTNTLLKTEKNVNGGIEYTIKNKEVTKKAEDNLSIIERANNKLNTMLKSVVLEEANKQLNRKIEDSDLNSYKDVNKLMAYLGDPSRTDLPLAQYIYKIAAASNRTTTSEFYNNVEKPIEDIEKELGLDSTKEKNVEFLLQKNDKGEIVPALINKYSNSYFDYISNLKSKIRSYKRHAKISGSNNKRVRGQRSKIVKELNENFIIADIGKLDSENKQVVESEKNRIINELGQEHGEELIDRAYNKYHAYKIKEASYRKYIEARQKTNSIKTVTEEEMLDKIASFKKFNDPAVFIEELNTESSILTENAFDHLAYAPKKTNGKFYDARFEELKNNEKKYSYYLKLKEIVDKSLSMLPIGVTEKLEENFLPEEVQTDMLSILKGDSTINDLKNKFFKSIATEEESSKVDIVSSDNKRIKTVPINQVTNSLRTTKFRIARLKDSIEMSDNLIDTYIKKIEDLKLRRPGLESQGFDVDMSINSYKHNIEEETNKIKKYKEVIPFLKDKYDNLIKYRSKDVVKLIKDFAMMSYNYKNKTMILDKVEAARKVINEFMVKEESPKGKALINKAGELVRSEGDSNISKMINSHIDALIYGEYKKNEGITGFKIAVTEKSRTLLREIKTERRKNEADYFNGKIDDEEFLKIKEKLDEKMEKTTSIRNFTLSKAVDTLNGMIYKTNLGLNVTSAAANVIFGRLANFTEAAAEVFFNRDDLKEAYKLLQSSFIKAVTGKDNKISYKIRNVIMHYGTLFDLLEDSYGKNRALTDKQKKLGLLNLMEMQRRGEYRNQGAVTLATLLHEKLKTKDGKEISFFDALTDEGKINRDLIENAEEYEPLSLGGNLNSGLKLTGKIEQIVKRLHGNYNLNAPMMAKKYAVGRLILAFKTFMPEGFMTRFEKRHFDEELNYDVEGRFKAFTNLGFANSINTLKGIFLERYLKRDYFNDKNIDKLDLENMKRNFQEIQVGLMTMGLTMLAASLFKDNEDDTFGIRHTLHLVGRLQQDITMFFNPVDLVKLFKNPVPAISYLNQLSKIPAVTYKYATMDDKQHDADYLLRNYSKVLPVTKQLYRTFWGNIQH